MREVKVVQLSPTALPGAFDELFYRLLLPNDFVDAIAPGTSLLILAGCSLSAWRWRQLKGEPFFWVNTGAIGLWGGCVFGWVPSSLLATIPLLNRVGHVNADFSLSAGHSPDDPERLWIQVPGEGGEAPAGGRRRCLCWRSFCRDDSIVFLRTMRTGQFRGIIFYVPGREPLARRCCSFS